MAPQTMRRKDTALSRRQVEEMIANGRQIVIFNGKVLKLDAWMQYHPGGDKAIQHMVGKDATDEINAYHSTETTATMSRFQIGTVKGNWVNFRPPIQGGKFRSCGNGTNGDAGERRHEKSDDSTSAGSDSPSSVFDLIEKPGTATESVARKRTSSSSSECSILSLEDIGIEPSVIDLNNQKELEQDLATYPSLDAPVQENIIQKYRELDQRLRDEGLFECNYFRYFKESCRYTLLFVLFFVFLGSGHYVLSGACLGALWHQLVFTVHDAAHISITHRFHVDSVIGILIADFVGGLSVGWWKRNHNVHHIVTNYPEHDPDIQHLPFFAVSPTFFKSVHSTFYERTLWFDKVARFLIQYENYLYYPILTFGRFNLYRLSWEYLILGLGPRKGIAAWHRWLEITGQIVFWYWFGYRVVYLQIPTAWDRFVFIMVSHMITAPLHVQITLSHFAMSTADLGPTESFAQHQLRTCMDVDCPRWLDFFHGGLQFQAIHHLYPRMPRHNLRTAQKYLKEFCKEVELPYAIYGFVKGNEQVIGRLGEVARQARMLRACAGVVAKEQVRKTKVKNGM